MENQKYSSKMTSINKNKLPAIYKYNFLPNSTIIDYGCGKYVNHIVKYCKSKNLCWSGFDKYNQSKEFNKKCLNNADYCLCSNVLNVIQEKEIIVNIINEVVKKATRQAIFTIYEGNKSNIGKVSKNDCYQRNNTIKWYLELMENIGHKPYKKGKFIIIDK